MLRAVGRIIMVPLGFLIAALVAGFVLFTLGLEQITHAMHGAAAGVDTAQSVIDLAWLGTVIASGATILPALAVVIIGEVARIRSWLYYLIGGGLALAAIPLMAQLGPGEATVLAPTMVWTVFATAGFAGGLAYWLVAGRNA